MFGRAVAERRIVVSDDYPNDPSFVHFEGADRLVRTLGDPLLHRRPDDGRRPRLRRHGHVHRRASARTARRRSPSSGPWPTTPRSGSRTPSSSTSWPAPGRRSSGGPRPSAPCARSAPGSRSSATRPRSSSSPSTRRPALLGRRRRPDRPPRRARRRPLLGVRRGDRPAARSRADRRERRGEGRRGDLGAGGPRDAARLHRRLPPRRPLRARRRARTPTSSVTPIRSVIAVPLVGDRGPIGTLTVYTGEVDAFTEADARLLEALAGPGGDRDDERPADRGARDVAGRSSGSGRTRSGRSARSRPGSPRSATRPTSSSTSSTRPPGCSTRTGCGST